jgi:hypothetical protein
VCSQLGRQVERREREGEETKFLFFFSKFPKQIFKQVLNSLLTFETNHSIQNNMQQHVSTNM